jgi:predicted peptidase
MIVSMSGRGLFLLFSLLGAILMDQPSPAAGPIQSVHKLDKKVDLRLDYLLYLPRDYERKDAWPLLLFLHGAGERGSNIEKVKEHGPPKLVERGTEFPFIIVSPQCPEGEAWNWKLKSLSVLLDEVTTHYKVDPDRIYVTGLSMGGFGTWALAAYTPNRFAAIIPICGGGELSSIRRLKNLPIWAFHGAKDPIVPVERSQELMDALKVAHGNMKLTIYHDVGHDSWTATYDNPEIYKWLLEQKRSSHETKRPQ